MNKKSDVSLSRGQMKNIMGGTIQPNDDLKECPFCSESIDGPPVLCLRWRCPDDPIRVEPNL
ncbi:hypothetical protein SAMN04488522_105418 [Pedobacter caeni]|uniref:Uncharacterized protein n=1 Tax=Pedobacter caeni TaxID=288992 RepID=A0A1M5JLQ8_9SPHI|nr:hypothetical protein SAMN04488522_105418 [Pedobacter caeni]